MTFGSGDFYPDVDDACFQPLMALAVFIASVCFADYPDQGAHGKSVRPSVLPLRRKNAMAMQTATAATGRTVRPANDSQFLRRFAFV